MELVAKLDDYGKPAWIFVMVLGFILFWPIGLAILAYLIWSGRMACWKTGSRGRWHYQRERGGRDGRPFARRAASSSGNTAFDEYREETLRRLEDEQSEFQDFLERLRHAKDKEEFDDFMKERRDKPAESKSSKTPDAPDAAPQPSG